MSLDSRSFTRRSSALFILTLAACGGADASKEAAADAAATPAVRDPNTPVAVIAEGLQTPESVLWDATRQVWYISNINGNPPQKDDNGYILRVGPDGQKIDSLPFINGGDADVTLHAPKGRVSPRAKVMRAAGTTAARCNEGSEGGNGHNAVIHGSLVDGGRKRKGKKKTGAQQPATGPALRARPWSRSAQKGKERAVSPACGPR